MFQKAFASKGIIWGLFGLLFVYLALRAWFVAPMHDEAATFLHYIENGEIWGELALKDANNHLLNSWLGRGIYLLVGDSFFALRLPALFAFILYFWSSYSIVKRLKLGNTSLIVFLALNTLPWISEYFAYTRGYGIAIAFFLAALSQLVAWLQTQKNKHVLLAIGCMYFAVFANLTYLISSMLFVGFIGFYVLLNWKSFALKTRLLQLSVFALFGLLLYPLIAFSFELKEAGALYYGSLDGLWNVTGKTLSKNVLFYDANWLKYAFVLVVLGIAPLFMLQWKKLGFKQLIRQEYTWFIYLIVGNIAAILFLAKIMHVNYPEDRAAMYLVPLALLGLASLTNTHPLTKHAAQLYWFFPVVFILKMNLNTSVFSPDDRMTESFYLQATKNLRPDETLALYPIMQLTFPMWERKYRDTVHPAVIQKDFEPYADVILTKTTYLFPKDHWQKDYVQIAEDKPSTYIALRRKKAWNKTVVFDSLLTIAKTNAEYVDFIKIAIDSSWRNKPLQIDISGGVQVPKDVNTFNLVVATNDKNNQPFRYHYFNLRWFEGANKGNYFFKFPYMANTFKDDESQLIIYIWNRERKNVRISDARIRIKTLN